MITVGGFTSWLYRFYKLFTVVKLFEFVEMQGVDGAVNNLDPIIAGAGQVYVYQESDFIQRYNRMLCEVVRTN